MTNKIPEGMVTAYHRKLEPKSDLSGWNSDDAMRAALLWLADNVSDEMVFHLIGSTFKHRPPAFKFEYTVEQTREAIAAALRQAAGGGDE